MKYVRLILGCLLLTGCAQLPTSVDRLERDNAAFPQGVAKRQLEGVVVKEINFRQAVIRDIVDLLNNLEGPDVTKEQQVEDLPFVVLILPFDREAPLVTLSMRNASLFDIYQSLAKLTRSRFYVRGDQIYFEPLDPSFLSQEEVDAKTDPHSQ